MEVNADIAHIGIHCTVFKRYDSRWEAAGI